MSTRQVRLESDIAKEAVGWLRKQGCLCIKLSTLSRYGTSGWPDYLVLDRGGLAWFAEIKAPGRKLTPLQEERRAQLEEQGFAVYVVTSKKDAQEARRDVNG